MPKIWSVGLVVALDDLLEEVYSDERVAMVKIDTVVGGPLSILHGMSHTLQEYHPAMSVEVIGPGSQEENDINAFLQQVGYGRPVRYGFMLCYKGGCGEEASVT